MREVFISGYEGLYSVREDGVILSHIPLGGRNRVSRANPSVRRIVKTQSCSKKSPYKKFTICCGKTRKDMTVHRVVATAFIPNPFNKPCVNHIDGNKNNNHFTNLEWVDYQENTQHAIDNKLLEIQGELNPNSKLTQIQVKAILILDNNGMSQVNIAKCFNVTNHCIHKILKGVNWKN